MRYYKNIYPKVNDIVYVKFNRFTDQYTVIVNLVEYNNIEAMILATEINKKKINIEKIFNNKIIPCIVLNIDEEKSYIDLSLKRVLTEDSTKYKEKYPYIEKIVELGKEMQQLLDIYKENNNIPCLNIYQETIWEIFENNINNNLNEVYENLLKNPSDIFRYSKNLDSNFVDKCIQNYNKRIKTTDIIISNDFSLTVLETNAISEIKNLLTNIPDELTKNIKIECVSSPKYRIIITAKENDQINSLTQSFDQFMKNKINKKNIIYKLDDNNVIIKNKSYSLSPFKSFLKFF